MLNKRNLKMVKESFESAVNVMNIGWLSSINYGAGLNLIVTTSDSKEEGDEIYNH